MLWIRLWAGVRTVRRECYGKAGNQRYGPFYWVDVKRYSMDIGIPSETGAGSIGDCPVFCRKCVEDNVTGLLCRQMLGGIYEKKYRFYLYPCKDGSGIRESQVCGTGFMG